MSSGAFYVGDRVTALNSFLGLGMKVITCYSASEDFIIFFPTLGREDLASMLMTDAKKLNTYTPLKVSGHF